MRLAICGQSQWESHLGCWRAASVQWLECDLHFKEMNSKKVLVFFFSKSLSAVNFVACGKQETFIFNTR